ncbi:MAG: TetR/AcrR family transcriptional regulator [Rhodobacteraceae bacterium]|nr:TetR/AcrR family transcriptional regulator [Paracoccaceae bacterium]
MDHLIPEAEVDPRRAAIIGAAFDVFCRYGFRRTAMEDIARAAGMSRAALYLHYRNKQDIFRSLAQHYYDVTDARLRQALRPGLSPQDALDAVVDAKAGPELEAMFASPHGEELLDANFSTSADIVRAGEARIAAILADWLASETRADRITLAAVGGDADALATTIIGAISGLKTPSAGYAAFRADCGRLMALIGRGLRR